MRRVVMLCEYRLQPERVGGADRLFWALQERMLARGWHVKWLFPSESDYSHYAGRRFDIALLPAATFLRAATQYLRGEGRTDLLVSIFASYTTRYTVEWKRAGVRRYIAIDQMSRPAAASSASKRLRLAMKGLALYPFVSRIVAVSGFVRNSILWELGPHWARKVRVIPNGVDANVFYPRTEEPSDEAHPLHIVAVAHLIPEKGVQVLLQALHQAKERLPNVVVSIAGDGYYAPNLRAMTSRLGLEGQVRFLGNISNQEILLRDADIAVVPSLWQEAFGFTVAEAMASAAPVIASRIGGVPELVDPGRGGQQAGRLVPPGDSGALAEALVELAKSAHLRRQLGQAGLHRVHARYSLEGMARGYYACMEGMVLGTS